MRRAFCDSCDEEIIDMAQVVIVHANKRGDSFESEPTHFDLCPDCYKGMIDWINDDYERAPE